VPYPPGHRIEKREMIVQSARRLFNQHGFDSVSVKQIMAGAGLTHGGFYSYFQGKSDLYAEALACFFTDPNWKNRWEGVEVDPTSGDLGPQVVRAYLSRQHFEDVENSCPMVALPTDARRKGRSTRIAFETVFQAMVGTLARSVEDKSRIGRTKAAAIAALCVGGMVVARAMQNELAADELRVACMSVALELGGWPKTAGRKNGRTRPLRAAGD
jgi:TetR/AcrR family transcriptional repressor of nem operon